MKYLERILTSTQEVVTLPSPITIMRLPNVKDASIQTSGLDTFSIQVIGFIIGGENGKNALVNFVKEQVQIQPVTVCIITACLTNC